MAKKKIKVKPVDSMNKRGAELLSFDNTYPNSRLITVDGIDVVKCWKKKNTRCESTCAAFEIVEDILIKCKALPVNHLNQYIAKLKEKI